ncbi:MAG TPA: chemotaxis protein CheB [Caulobacteraceae bacterium]|nr:chemotaxis protein CheB [Caulobacteraceae bacterium]
MDAIVVIGASQGGVLALRQLVHELPADFPAPVVIVMHIGQSSSLLPAILNNLGPLQASHVENGEALRPGHIHVAPPDRHILILDGCLALSRGPRENWARPAVDPLFRTAAEAYGENAIGVILTGQLNDGTAGLFEIKRRGGVAIVQDPAEAEAPSMPRSAMENVAVDYVLPVSDIAAQLVRLVEEKSRSAAGVGRLVARSAIEMETRRLQVPTAQTCPECGGAMREEVVGAMKSFRCHIGHTMTAEVLALAQVYALEKDLDTVVRSLNERAALCRDIAAQRDAKGRTKERDRWLAAADQALEYEAGLWKLAEIDWINPEAPAVPALEVA